ncbi:non-heme iron oxygenase ferredoxin subunit [Telluria beijingensis]|uniref:non-heme iron oxygenase ferredoxin subunit n=1 Tax=Telluria beijingensis TaxID=3068633 RepID=UPI002795484B|nr:non-heme iron oxygenase ferredoxin subunit [Massilia sp. REN29]
MSATWIPIAKVADVPLETGTLRVAHGGEAVCLYLLGGDVRATQDKCPHGNASLSEGYIVDEMIECPLHQGLFDIATGEVRSPPCTVNLATYPVKVEDGVIYLEETA